MAIVVKRVYETASRTDGARVLVDRLWPRGLTKERAAVDEWLRDLAPSDELRRWYHARPEQWADFRKKYLKELSQPEAEGRAAPPLPACPQTKAPDPAVCLEERDQQ
jgi:uncharacterized protein YeaO (DUF488 family)